VASFLVVGSSEDQVDSRIVAVEAWFNSPSTTVYAPLPLASSATASASAKPTDSKDTKSAPSTSSAEDPDRDLTYADTLRLTTTAVLHSFLSLIHADPLFEALAVVVTQADVSGFEGLVASAEWEAFYRAVWDCSAVPPVKAQESRFVSLLQAVEGGAAYRVPQLNSPAGVLGSQAQALLRTAITTQCTLLSAVMRACDAEMAAQCSAIEFIRDSFNVFGDGSDPYVLLSNIDQL
jgi:hypothetical protein